MLQYAKDQKGCDSSRSCIGVLEYLGSMLVGCRSDKRQRQLMLLAGLAYSVREHARIH